MILSALKQRTILALLQDSATALLFPTSCRVCGAPLESLATGVACDRCWQDTENSQLDFDHCGKCGIALPRLARQPQVRRCRHCDKRAFAHARACGNYRGALRESIIWLKLHPAISQHLKKLLVTAFWQIPNAEEIDLILPVPLHPSRQKERTFNQAEIIGRVLSLAVGIPIYPTALQRTKATEKHRVGMDATTRIKSLEGAFTVYAPRLIANRNILLVDDVMTTGSTAHVIAETLLSQGAQSVQVLALARAVTHHIS